MLTYRGKLLRSQVCPLLLRVFPRRGGHHRLEEFARRGDEPEGELTMYTWPDATLRELTDLVKEVRQISGFRLQNTRAAR